MIGWTSQKESQGHPEAGPACNRCKIDEHRLNESRFGDEILGHCVKYFQVSEIRIFARLIRYEQVCPTQDNDLDPNGYIVNHAPMKEVGNNPS